MRRRVRNLRPPVRRDPDVVVLVVHVHPQVLAAALRLAGGDHARLKILDDGSVLVLNRPREHA